MKVTVRRPSPFHAALPLVFALAAVGLGPRKVAAQQLMSEVLTELDGRVLTVHKLVYSPGQSAAPHRHPAYLAAYVVSGQVESSLGDDLPVLYGPGDVWYESPMQLHRTFRNPSATEAVTVIVFGLRAPGAPGLVPEPDVQGLRRDK